MGPFRRWLLLAGVIVLMIGVPLAVAARPVPSSSVGATALLQRIERARSAAYSGFVQSQGHLALPVAHRFTDVAALAGGRTALRVWWRGSDDWRVDEQLTTGEDDLIHRHGTTTEWNYEKQTASSSVDPQIRLPRTADLLPPSLARRVLADVRASEVHRIGSTRVAGRVADGLRVVPAAAQASVDHVDLWADRATGVVLRTDVYGAGPTPAVTTAFTEFTPGTPPASDTAFQAAPGVRHVVEGVLDIADAANQYAPLLPPATVAGLPRSPSARRAVGLYGRGVTQLMALPLRRGDAGALRDQLVSSGGLQTPAGVLLRVGVLGVYLTDSDGPDWLVAGTVTDAALARAGRDLRSRAVFR